MQVVTVSLSLLLAPKGGVKFNHRNNRHSILIFSSPEPKAQVNYCDGNLSVVCHRHRRRKLFTFSSSPPEPVGQFR